GEAGIRDCHVSGVQTCALPISITVDVQMTVDFPGRKIITADGATCSLTPTESRLLYILMRSSGETVATDFLLRRMWPREVTYEEIGRAPCRERGKGSARVER